MFEHLKFSIGGRQSGNKAVALWNENGEIYYEILDSGLLDIPKGKYQANVTGDFFAGWETADVSSWDAVYGASDAQADEAWRITVCEDGVTYRSEGNTSYPKQWQQFLDWLDVLIPEMEFVPPKRIEQVVFRYKNARTGGIYHERLEINRAEQMVHLEAWGDSECADAPYLYSVKSSHRYDFVNAKEHMSELMNHCQQFFDSIDFVETDAFMAGYDAGNPVTRIRLELHNGSTLKGRVGSSHVPGWTDFLRGVHRYMGDLSSELFNEF